MKYKIKELMKEFKNLGGSIDDFGYPNIPDFDGLEDSLVGACFQSLEQNRKEYIEKAKTSSPKEREKLETEYNAKQDAIRAEIDELYYKQSSNKAYAIYDVIKLAETLHNMGLDVDEEVDKETLTKLFVELGGNASGSSYTIPGTPDPIKQIEAEIEKLQQECHAASHPFTLFDEDEKKVEKHQISLIDKIDKLKTKLRKELPKHPEYHKLKTLLDSINAIDHFEKFKTPQKALGE